MLHIISRKDAKQFGLSRYFTGNPCKFGHIAERYCYNGDCIQCSQIKYQTNSDYLKQQSKQNYYNNLDANKATMKQWRNNNIGIGNYHSAKRHTAKLKRTPIWLTIEDMEHVKQIYITAQELTELTGIPFHVDHIIPLRGEIVSGLHIPSNLQILPFYENLSKSNNF